MPDIDRGDIVWLELHPSVGREQAGHRPHLVLSDRRLHAVSELLITVPLTRQLRDWPTRVRVGESSQALCDQPRAISLERITKVEKTGYDVAAVRDLLTYLMGGEFPGIPTR